MEHDLNALMRHNYLKYASYVILDRAIPHALDGLKPVQRRILHTLFTMDDGKLHKVANVAGQTMALHPHGDAPINEAIVNLANKGYLLEMQGNFGNPLTGDPAAAPRYIEVKLSPLAKETLFNPQLTTFVASYDGRRQEPTVLPAKIPFLLLQGAEGIAVGMATKILPHNFQELLLAEVAYLEGKPFTLYPDLPSGGKIDASDYSAGKGKLRVRATIVEVDAKTLKICDVPYGITSESLMRSIDEAARRGKLKIDTIHDYTTEKVAIEIKLPRGVYAKETLEALYAFTDCEVSLHCQIVAICEERPWETTVNELLAYHAEQLVALCTLELSLERDALQKTIYQRELEELFISEKIYKSLEEVKEQDELFKVLDSGFRPWLPQLLRMPTKDELEQLLAIPIRRISRFDREKNQQLIAQLQTRLQEVLLELTRTRSYSVSVLKRILKKYGSQFPRRSQLTSFHEVNVRSLEEKPVRVGYDSKSGFLGTKVVSEQAITCTNFDKLLLFFNDGSYRIVNIGEKEHIITGSVQLIYLGAMNKETIFTVAYRPAGVEVLYLKRFAIEKFILDKVYRYLEEGAHLDYFSSQQEGFLELSFAPAARLKKLTHEVSLSSALVKGVAAKGVRIANRPVVQLQWKKSVVN